MANKQLKLKIITPERIVLEEMVDSVTIPTTEGEIGIFPNHIPLVSTLKSGDIVAKKGDEIIPMAVAGGFIEIKNNGENITEVAVLADFAEHVSELSDFVVAKAKARAEELLKMKENGEVVDFEHFEAELERTLTRTKVADKWRNKKYRL
jgi:F-type H+-transporting ATPase subunit epsilon